MMLGDLLPTSESPIIDVVQPAPRYLYPVGIDPREPIYRGDVFYLAPTTIGPLVPTRTTAAYPTLPAQLPTTPIIPVPSPPVYTPLPAHQAVAQSGFHIPVWLIVGGIVAAILLKGR